MKFPEPAIYKLLSAALGHTRIYPLRAPQKLTAPFIIYQRTGSNDRWRSIGGPSNIAQANIQIDVYAENYEDAKNIAGTIERTLDGYRGTVYYGASSPQLTVDAKAISLQGEFDTLDQTDEPFLFRNSADYLVTYEQGAT